jgi:TolB-like protein
MPRLGSARLTSPLLFPHQPLTLWIYNIFSSEPPGTGSLRYLFEDCALDTSRRELHRAGEVVAVAPQVFDLLHYLICNRERVVSKDDLIAAIWEGRAVSDAALTTRLNVARGAIGDSGEEQRLIKTLPRKGVRFVATVREAPVAAEAATQTHLPNPQGVIGDFADKPSIAILPFTNLSSDPEQEYFADGMVEDIITGLSRSRSLFVIARQSTFVYKGKPIDIKQVRHDLGVRYVLEGSIRRAGDRVRITGKLIEADAGVHLWADQFDGELEDIFRLQDQVTGRVIGAIAPQLERAEIERARRKPTESLRAYDYYLRALSCVYRFTRKEHDEGFGLARTAREIDSEFARAYALGANLLMYRKSFGWRKDADQERIDTRRLARRAIQLDRNDPLVLAEAGQALGYVVGELEEGASLVLQAVELDPNLAVARFWAGWAHLWLGNVEAGLEQFQLSLRLNPLDPRIYGPQTGVAFANFFAGRDLEAVSWARTALAQQPRFLGAWSILAASHAMAGRIDEAKTACAHLMELNPGLRVSTIKSRGPFRRAPGAERLMQALRIAGMPE